jgi:hypothetical protein
MKNNQMKILIILAHLGFPYPFERGGGGICIESSVCRLSQFQKSHPQPAMNHFRASRLQESEFCSETNYILQLLQPKAVCGTFPEHQCLPDTAEECSFDFWHKRKALETQLPGGYYSKHLTKGGRFFRPLQLAWQSLYNH